MNISIYNYVDLYAQQGKLWHDSPYKPLINKHCYQSLDLRMNKTSGESVSFTFFNNVIIPNTQMEMTDYVNFIQNP